MLPDFRFAMGAVLAVTMLGVAGFGLVSSVRLVHDADVGTLATSRSLAFAHEGERGRFYDPDESRRFLGITGADVLDDSSSQTTAETNAAPLQPPTFLPKMAASADHAVPPGAIAAATPAANPADDTVAALTPDKTAPPDTPKLEDPAPIEHVAEAPATPSEPQTDDGPPAKPISGVVPLPPVQPKPVVHARPKRRHFAQAARAHVHPAQPDTFPNSGFSSTGTTTTQWPSYNDPFNTSSTARKSRTQVSGR